MKLGKQKPIGEELLEVAEKIIQEYYRGRLKEAMIVVGKPIGVSEALFLGKKGSNSGI